MIGIFCGCRVIVGERVSMCGLLVFWFICFEVWCVWSFSIRLWVVVGWCCRWCGKLVRRVSCCGLFVRIRVVSGSMGGLFCLVMIWSIRLCLRE